MKMAIKSIIYILLIIGRYLNIGLYLWVFIRSIIFDRPTTDIPFAEPLGLFFYAFILSILIIVDISIIKNEKKVQNSKIKLLLKFIQIFILYLYLLTLYQTINNIYIHPDISVSQYWDSGEWKW